jgi:hypothetical protein
MSPADSHTERYPVRCPVALPGIGSRCQIITPCLAHQMFEQSVELGFSGRSDFSSRSLYADSDETPIGAKGVRRLHPADRPSQFGKPGLCFPCYALIGEDRSFDAFRKAWPRPPVRLDQEIGTLVLKCAGKGKPEVAPLQIAGARGKPVGNHALNDFLVGIVAIMEGNVAVWMAE